MLFAALSAATLVSVASAQMTVQVGSTASASGGIFQFIPPSITAPNGTTVTFQWVGAPGNHTVTQSTFADPCDPVAGGFDSGWVFVPASPALAQTPTWNLTITDDTKPIWFFCKQLAPSPHCSAGMVGAINAPTTGNTFAAFQAAAKSFSKAPGQGEGGLVGIGASASAGVGPIPSGATAYSGVPLATSTPSGTGPASGSPSATGPASGSPSATGPASGTGPASAPAGSQTAPAPGSSTTKAPSSASGVAANSIVAMLAAALGFVLV